MVAKKRTSEDEDQHWNDIRFFNPLGERKVLESYVEEFIREHVDAEQDGSDQKKKRS